MGDLDRGCAEGLLGTVGLNREDAVDCGEWRRQIKDD